MSRQFKSTDSLRWNYGFGYGQYDATIGNEEHSWNGTTRFQANGSITGTAGQTSFVKPVGWGHEGFCLLHQTQGTGAGNWELAYVNFAGASAVSDQPLQNTYSTGAQIVTLSNGRTGGYNNVTVSGTLTAPAWNGSTGGLCVIFARGTVNITGAISAEGKGWAGGLRTRNTPFVYQYQTNQGAGYPGGGSGSAAANGNGGGGGYGTGGDSGAGGGGGNGTAGANGTANKEGYIASGGAAVGNAGLTSMFMGGGGGAGADSDGASEYGGNGGAGAGIIIIIAKSITGSGYLLARGTAGQTVTTPQCPGGGGGAGGSILLKAQTAVLGSGLVLATGGAGGAGMKEGSGGVGLYGGAGGSGRIHLDYSQSYSGSTSPTLNVTLDNTLKYPGNRKLMV